MTSITLNAQEKVENLFFRDIAIEYGFYPSLTTSYDFPTQHGSVFSITSAHFPMPKTGYRIGLTVLSDMDGSNTVYTVPLYFTYRTSTRRSLDISSTTQSLNELIFQLILSILPKNAEFNVGANLGFTSPDGSVSYVIIDGTPYANDFELTRQFITTIDAGIRMNYKIWRFGVTLSPSVSYLASQNYRFKSTIFNDPSNGYKPSWFFRATIGVAFVFKIMKP